jgi:hypothetical protein
MILAKNIAREQEKRKQRKRVWSEERQRRESSWKKGKREDIARQGYKTQESRK